MIWWLADQVERLAVQLDKVEIELITRGSQRDWAVRERAARKARR